ncbi:hypothetical protein FSHL1_008168 [Fusarium sambucinum]
MAIQKVAVIKGSGLLGSKVVDGLLNTDFERVDITSIDSVKDAVIGQDAVVSTATTIASGGQKVIIDAVIAVRVPRFILSVFGIPSRQNRNTKIGKILAAKVQNTDYLIELFKQHDCFSWTGLSNGLFLDSNLKNPYSFIDIRNRKFRVVDSGNEPYSTTSLSFVGKAIASIPKKTEETANRYINIADKFDVSHASGAEIDKIGDDKISNGDFSAFGNYLEQFLFTDGAGNVLKGYGDAIGLLGRKEESLEGVIKSVLAGVE